VHNLGRDIYSIPFATGYGVVFGLELKSAFEDMQDLCIWTGVEFCSPNRVEYRFTYGYYSGNMAK
jgi:hypothetical protein